MTIPEKKAPPVAKEPEKACSTCGRPLRYITQYKRWYCSNCKAYEGVRKVEPRPAGAPPAVKRCPTCGSNMKYVPRHKRYYCYSCQAYRSVTAPPQKVTVAVVPPGARPGARPVTAAPAVVPKDRAALVGAILILFGVIFFIVSGLLTLMVFSGSTDSISIYESGALKLTLYGDLVGFEIDIASGTVVNTFNILLFLAILFGGVGVALYGFSMAKWLPRIGEKK